MHIAYEGLCDVSGTVGLLRTRLVARKLIAFYICKRCACQGEECCEVTQCYAYCMHTFTYLSSHTNHLYTWKGSAHSHTGKGQLWELRLANID